MADNVFYTDGACLGNPGPGGWGVYAEHLSPQEYYGSQKNTTNNRMELQAAIEALKMVTPGNSATIYTDSQYVCKGIQGWIVDWKKRGWKTSARKPVLNKDLWEILDDLNSARTIRWVWVKGHAGVHGNEMADALSVKGAKEA